jgi:glycosyltransferase involved in cell wall biosynthesis
MLVRELSRRGHSVLWWTSTFDHFSKRHIADSESVISPWPNLEIELLHTPGYKRNVSIARLRDHRELAARFRERAHSRTPPDLVWASFPTIELCDGAVKYSRVFELALPSLLRPVGRLALLPLKRIAQRTLSGASRLVGTSESYLKWGCELAGRPRRETDAVFPLGYEQNTSSESDRAAALELLRCRGVDPGKNIVWYVGGFGWSYDLEPVIAAARAVAAEGDQSLQFVLSGSGGSEETLKSAASGLPNVVFTGWLNGTGLAAMRQVAALGLAAYSARAPQSLPNKIFEYMSGGLPILSSLRGECARFLKLHQCGATYSSTAELIEHIGSFRANPQKWAEMGAKGRAAFLKEYDSSVIYPRMADYIEECLAAHRAGTMEKAHAHG